MTDLLAKLAIAVVACTLLACGGDAPETMLAQPDFATFEANVYPVLLRDCGFNACHGSTERFFQVFGPGRARLDPLMPLLEAHTPAEVAHSYSRALSMIDVSDPGRSLLVRKPLTLAAGGAGHEGVDSWMRAVYVSRQEPGFVALNAWVLGIQSLAQGAAP
jgi:hypothetical protein